MLREVFAEQLVKWGSTEPEDNFFDRLTEFFKPHQSDIHTSYLVHLTRIVSGQGHFGVEVGLMNLGGCWVGYKAAAMVGKIKEGATSVLVGVSRAVLDDVHELN